MKRLRFIKHQFANVVDHSFNRSHRSRTELIAPVKTRTLFSSQPTLRDSEERKRNAVHTGTRQLGFCVHRCNGYLTCVVLFDGENQKLSCECDAVGTEIGEPNTTSGRTSRQSRREKTSGCRACMDSRLARMMTKTCEYFS